MMYLGTWGKKTSANLTEFTKCAKIYKVVTKKVKKRFIYNN